MLLWCEYFVDNSKHLHSKTAHGGATAVFIDTLTRQHQQLTLDVFCIRITISLGPGVACLKDMTARMLLLFFCPHSGAVIRVAC